MPSFPSAAGGSILKCDSSWGFPFRRNRDLERTVARHDQIFHPLLPIHPRERKDRTLCGMHDLCTGHEGRVLSA